MRRVPALIIGGGPAGAAAAIVLARAGTAAELIERTPGAHDKVCGGFLGWDALAALGRLGIDPSRLGARPIRRLRLVSGARIIETALPRAAAGLSRRCLDEALLDAALAAGAQVRRGVTARSAEVGLVRLDDGEAVAADALYLATGKHELRGLARPVPPQRGEGAVGFRAAIAADRHLERTLGGVIELHLFDGGYAGLLMQEDGRANLCLSVSAARLREAGGRAALLAALGAEAPQLGERLALAGEVWVSVSNVPYGWRAHAGTAALYRVGDQASVIASLAGDGVAIALTSGMAAGEAMLRGRSGEDFQPDWAKRAARPLRIGEWLRAAAEGRRARGMLVAAARIPGAAALAARLTRIG